MSLNMFDSFYLKGFWYNVLSLLQNRAVITKNLCWRGMDVIPCHSISLPKKQVGWIVADHIKRNKICFEHLRDSLKMRVANIALWVNEHSDSIYNSMYDPDREYDLVVFFKAMSPADIEEARKIKAYGGKVIFDANVNYYEIWGEFKGFSNRPTKEQQEEAVRMTSLADICVGDSSNLSEVVKKYNTRTFWVPDNVDIETFRYVRKHRPMKPVRIVWSGISFKAEHLLMLEDVFPQLDDVELVLVSEKRPQIIKRLNPLIKCRFVPYSDQGYARILSQCDIIISSKELVNSYEVGHTEYKITLGMAAGLPAVASPQQSYIEAISANGGGIIATTTSEWLKALKELINDYRLREEMGSKARQTVIKRYSTPVVAGQYLKVIEECLSS